MMTRTTSTILAMGVLCLAAATVHAAGTLELPADLDGTVSHYYNSMDNRVTDSLGTSAYDFVTNLATYDSMHADLVAPPGKVIQVDLPSGKTGYLNIYLNWFDPSVGQGAVRQHPTTTQLLDVVGSPNLTLTYEDVHTRTVGAQVSIQQAYSFTAPFTFRGWDMGFNGPFLPNAVMNYELSGAAMSFNYISPTDGGQFVHVVPEPATMSILGLGACLPLLRGLRRRRRS